MIDPQNHWMSRRRCLTAAGVTLALPFLETLKPISTASAAPASSRSRRGPVNSDPRMVCIGVALSMYPGEWNPKQTGKGYQAPKLIKPFEDLREHFTLISNADHPGVKGGHQGTAAFLSGVYKPERIGDAIVVRNQITLDQLAAQTLGQNTRYQSMQFATSEIGPSQSLSWNDKGVALPALSDPFLIYRKLFVREPNPKDTARRMKMGRSILDLVNEDAKLLASELSKTDKDRMDQYMTSVRDVEKGISREMEWLNTPKPRGYPKLNQRPTTYHDNLDLILELTALALETDSTRVITVSLPGNGLPINYGNKRTRNYHGQSHHGKVQSTINDLVAIEAMHSQSVAKFLKRLQSIKTTDGNLLDCTQVLFGSGLGNGSSHSNRDLPVMVAGGKLKHGHHLKLKEGTPLCNVYVTMMQQMGIEIDKFAGSNGTINEFVGA